MMHACINCLVPSGPPQSLRVVSTAVSNITIEWDEVSCSERNGPIGNYTITVTGPYYWTPTEELLQYTTSRVYMVLDLHPRSTYTLTVRAANSDNLNHPGPPAWLSANTAIPLGNYPSQWNPMASWITKVIILCWLILDLGFLFLGHLYGNNSIVNIEEIGEGSSSLLCLTDNIQCCFPYELRMFNITYPHWYFPNGSEIAFRKSGIYESFYRNRGPSVVRLHRRHNATVPNGVFHCTMPDINRTNQTLYIGVYSLRNGILSFWSIYTY